MHNLKRMFTFLFLCSVVDLAYAVIGRVVWYIIFTPLFLSLTLNCMILYYIIFYDIIHIISFLFLLRHYQRVKCACDSIGISLSPACRLEWPNHFPHISRLCMSPQKAAAKVRFFKCTLFSKHMPARWLQMCSATAFIFWIRISVIILDPRSCATRVWEGY